jgi:hypothetical protein
LDVVCFPGNPTRIRLRGWIGDGMSDLVDALYNRALAMSLANLAMKIVLTDNLPISVKERAIKQIGKIWEENKK